MKVLKALSFYDKLWMIAIIVIVFIVVNALANRFVEKKLTEAKQKSKRSYNRIVTVFQLVSKIFKIITLFLMITIVLSVMGIETSPILATLGVGSLAFGIGAQNLVKDIINGFFIIFEDQFSVGDLVDIVDKTGRVEEVGLRVTKLRDFDGRLHIIPNSKIDIVTNSERGAARSRIDIPVDRNVDPDFAISVLNEVTSEFKTHKDILDGPIVWGVTENRDNSYILSLVFYTEPGKQYDLEHELRSKVISAFNSRDILVPKIRYTEV